MKKIFLILCVPFVVFGQTKDYTENVWEKSESYNLLGNREESINVLLKNIDSLEVHEKKNVFNLSSIYNYLGLRYQTYGKWDKSAFAYTSALLLVEKTNKYDSLKSNIYLNLGLLYVKTGDASADYYLDTAEELAVKTNNNGVLFVLYKVRQRLDEGIRFAKQIRNNQYLANYYYYKAMPNTLESKLYFDSARLVMPKFPQAKLQNFQYHLFIVDYFLRDNRIDSALYHCEKAAEIPTIFQIKIH